MRFKARILVTVVFLAAAASASGNFWESKDFKKWSKQECERMLNNSPWAQHVDSALPVFATVGQDTPDTTIGRASSTQISYVVQLRSALPLRQAVVRQELIRANADSKPVEQQRQMEGQAQRFIEAPMEVVLVHVVYGSNVQNYDRELANYWQHQTLETLKNSFFLIGAHGRVSPVDLQIAPGGGREFEVTFPRTVNGEPMIGPSDKTLSVEFMAPVIGAPATPLANRGSGTASDPGHVLVQFKVAEMMMGGKVVF